MYIRGVRIQNYKGFNDSGWIQLAPGCTVIVGANNAGKSALLECVASRFVAAPHRSEATKPTRGSHVDPNSVVEFELVTTGDYVRTLIAEKRWDSFYLPRALELDGDQAFEKFLNQSEIVLRGSKLGGADPTFGRDSESLGYATSKHPEAWNHWVRDATGNKTVSPVNGNLSDRDLRLFIWKDHQTRTFAFDAQRLNISECELVSTKQLDRTARNLPAVLSVLQANSRRFERYNALVRRVLPSLTKVSVTPSQPKHVRIDAWNLPPDSERDDLAISLADCGTGVSQVLAMLYVVTSAEQSLTIAIDEPGSFLHPGALAELLAIFRENSQHQYVIATHTPSAILALEPAQVHLLTQAGNVTTASPVSHSEIEEQRRILEAIGARLSDVFGPSRIIWVEGPSESRCFAEIARAFRIPMTGTVFVPVVSTGDFEASRRKAELAPDVYQRLTTGIALVPPALRFFFDRESRTEEECKRMRERCSGRLQFTARPMLENYLLDETAISMWLRANGEPSDPGAVSEWIVGRWTEGGAGRFGAQSHPTDARDSWLREVHGAKLLGNLIRSLSENRLAYDKVRDAHELCKIALREKSTLLDPLATELSAIVAAT